METTNSSATELVRLGTIREMLRPPGPCVTIMLPPYHPGEAAATSAALLKTNIQEAARQLAERGLSKSASASLLQPLERLAEDPTLASGSQVGRAIFRSPSVFEQFHLAQPVKASLRVGGSFAIRQLAAELMRPRAFYILALSKEGVSLHRCAGFHAEVVKLPPGIPDTLAEALALEPPDHDLENRSSAGSSVGAMRGVRFGTGSGREQQHAHLGDYYKLVDRGLQEFLREPETPLILAGVDEDTNIYRAGSNYPHLVSKSISGSPDFSREQTELLQDAYSILRTDHLERERTAVITARERTTPSRFSTDLGAILEAAFEGRVGHLYLDEGAERIEVFERGAYRSWGTEDLLNLAAVQTILHHGKTCELPTEMMPDGSIAVGLMRF